VSNSTPIKVNIAGSDADDGSSVSDVLAFTVERDMGQPDMCSIVLSNQDAMWSTKVKPEDTIDIQVGNPLTSIYKGEVVGMDLMYRGGEKSRLTVRGMNKLHRLLRQRKSITFTDKSDEDIIKQAAGSLSLEFKHEKTLTYKHVYQHNQTDLEFIRMRAGRIGCHVWCVDQKLYVKQPDLQQGPVATLKISASGDDAVRTFAPRLSAASIVKKVTVKGWNPETKELITGEAQIQASRLGQEDSGAGSHGLAGEETFMVDMPIWDKQEADVLAKARLTDIVLTYISGECEFNGNSKYDLGNIEVIVASAEQTSSNDPFNGRYYIMGMTHRYSSSKTKDGGFITILRLARDMQKGG
jgi:hypothetical protein